MHTHTELSIQSRNEWENPTFTPTSQHVVKTNSDQVHPSPYILLVKRNIHFKTTKKTKYKAWVCLKLTSSNEVLSDHVFLTKNVVGCSVYRSSFEDAYSPKNLEQ